ncbi:3-carboxy-cis,cis-muconate cycloisomerase [Halovulum sp. GXIMD14793]
MAISPFDSALMSGSYGDPEVQRLFSDSAQIRAMLMVEGALARVQGAHGLIPAEAAARISAAAQDVLIDPATLAAGAAASGTPVPALVEAFRAQLGEDAAPYVHWGTTSQDIADTGLVLRLRRVLDIFDARLADLATALAGQAARHRQAPMVAVTRGQPATLTTLGARIAGWGMPLLRHIDRIEELRPRLLQVSLGGASGTLAALGRYGPGIADVLAEDLGLQAASLPWHTARDGMAEVAGLMALITGTLGKMGGDMLLAMRDPASGFYAGDGGGSSTMPHKRNPVVAEHLVHLAQMNASLISGVHQAMQHRDERDGAAWATETALLPQMIAQAALACLRAHDLVTSLRYEPGEITSDLIFAEACSFALARHQPRPVAQARIAEAVTVAVTEGKCLRAVLEAAPDLQGMDWSECFDPARQLGAAPLFADRFVAAVQSRFQDPT